MFAEYYAHNKVYIDHCVSLISIILLLFIRSKSSCVLDDFQWEYKDVFLVDFCRSTLDVFLVDFYLTLKVNVIHLQIKIQRFS
jgi:hypothetical protein